jgi:hypothetical protein
MIHTRRRALEVVAVVVALCCAVAGCGSVKGKKITEENKAKLFEEIKTSHDLTVEEVGLLQRYVMRSTLQATLAGKEAGLPIGKTVGELIKEERGTEARAATEVHEESLRVDQARAEAEKQRAILRDAVTVTVFETSLESGEYEKMMACRLMFENHSGKDVRGFQGALFFRDLFGDGIIRLSLKEDDPLKAGASRRVSRYWRYNEFMDEQKRWAGSKLENMKVEWEPKTILFTDGTSLNAGDDD